MSTPPLAAIALSRAWPEALLLQSCAVSKEFWEEFWDTSGTLPISGGIFA